MTKRKTTEEFINEAKEIHKNEDGTAKYLYNKTVYNGSHGKIIITCPIHGDFSQVAKSHLSGCGCPKCSNINRRKDIDNFITEAQQIHKNEDGTPKYDYSNVNYINALTKVTIICPIHGAFEQKPSSHLSGCGCPQCNHRSYVYTKEEFIEKAKEIHGDKYDYSKVNYINANTKVCIICPIHGEFWQIPYNHLKGQNCPKCSHRSYAYTKEEFIEKAKEIHGNKYDYSKVEYVNNETKVCIICPIHGEFWQTPNNHFNSCGCYLCGKINTSITKTKTKEQFINDSKKIFRDFYDYSKVVYKGNKEKVTLICPKHGEFMVRPDSHLVKFRGCPQCAAENNHYETLLFNHISERFNNLIFFHSKRNIEGLGSQEIDIYNEKYNIGVEHQGNQHFIPINFFGGEKALERTKERDIRKIKNCQKINLKLFHFTYNKNIDTSNVHYKVYTDEEELFNDIQEYINKKERLNQ